MGFFNSNTIQPITAAVALQRHLYKIDRTSAWSDEDGAPCKGAVQYMVLYVDRRTVDDPKKVSAYGGQDHWWYSEGTNHRVEDGMICRDKDWRAEWFMEIADIVEFAKTHGKIIIDVDSGGFVCVEIYDDYRE